MKNLSWKKEDKWTKELLTLLAVNSPSARDPYFWKCFCLSLQ